MSAYVLHFLKAEVATAVETQAMTDCDNDAEAIDEACRRLSQMREIDAIEVWVGARKLVRLGRRPETDNRSGEPFTHWRHDWS